MSYSIIKCSKCGRTIDFGHTVTMGKYQLEIGEEEKFIPCPKCGARLVVQGEWDNLSVAAKGSFLWKPVLLAVFGGWMLWLFGPEVFRKGQFSIAGGVFIALLGVLPVVLAIVDAAKIRASKQRTRKG